MKFIKIFLNPLVLGLVSIVLFTSLTNLTFLESSSVGIFIFAFHNFINRLSVKFVFIDLIIFIVSIIWLLAPVIAYHVFNKQNKMAYLWDTYMKIDSQVYFSFVLPGTILFILGLKFPLNYQTRPHDKYLIENAKIYLARKGNLSLILIAIGFLVTTLNPFLPKMIQGIFSFFSLLTFIGVFYSLFSDFKYKKTIVFLALLLLLIQCILTGMYGELVYWSLLTFILVIIGYNYSLLVKLFSIIIGCIMILFIQSIKHEYRAQTWGKGMVRGADPNYFGQLIIKNFKSPDLLFKPKALFAMATRTNQGFLIAETMNYVPSKEPFANGETILTSIAASFVPRIFWPGKPGSGGKELIVRFLGAPDDLEYSYNLSPIGEAYANFGKLGAIIFMFFYGLLFNWVFEHILHVANQIPSIVLWLPILFIGPIQSMEGDVLGAINTMVKAAFFCWAMYFSFRVLFKLRL